jgi:PAS domain S-box-containing protein/putative nucleotidyltransferase with HDIG domain
MTVQHYSDPKAYNHRELRMLEFVSSEVAKSIEKKQAERALKREWEKAQQYLAIAEVMLLVLDIEGRIVMINRKGCRILGYAENELAGRDWFVTCVRPEERVDVRAVFKDIMAGRAEQQEYHENAVVTKSGDERLIAWHNTVVKDESGKILGTLSSGEDITEHRVAERALAESEELYRKLIAAIPDMIIRTDLKGNILFANDVALRAGGFRGAASLAGRNIFSFVAPEDADKAISAAKSMFENRLGPQEIRLLLNGNPKSLFEINGGVLRDINGIPYGMVFLCRDITERKQAEADLHQSVKKLRETLKASIDSLASAIEMRDPYTAGHQERVTRLACAIAAEMGLADERVEGIQVAAIIHDIGKLYVPAEILSKPTKLNELEYSLIKMHAQVGFTILSKIDFPWPIAQIVHQHHENINGSGYPRGLTGKDILLEARILCVADVVEAMSSHRPYRPALGIQVALDEISQKRGILYDREVVDACLKLFAEKRFKFE